MDYPMFELLIALAKASCIIAVGVFALLSARRSRKDFLSTRLGAANLALAFMLVPSIGIGTGWVLDKTVSTRGRYSRLWRRAAICTAEKL